MWFAWPLGSFSGDTEGRLGALCGSARAASWGRSLSGGGSRPRNWVLRGTESRWGAEPGAGAETGLGVAKSLRVLSGLRAGQPRRRGRSLRGGRGPTGAWCGRGHEPAAARLGPGRL